MPNEFLDGAGPYRLQVEESLSPGDIERFPLRQRSYVERGTKRFHARRVPYDTALLKNLSDNTTLLFEFNRQNEAVVQPNAADTFDSQSFSYVSVTNVGQNTIDPDDIVIQIKKEPYDADDAARASRKRSNIQNMVRGALNL